MGSILNSSSAVLATAVAVSGTLVALALGFQKLTSLNHPISHPLPRSCISSDERKDKKKKKVHFAEDVLNSNGNSRKKVFHTNYNSNSSKEKYLKQMPANRMALYAGILRDRVAVNRQPYFY